MRRRFHGRPTPEAGLRVNRQIRLSPVRVIASDGTNLGVMDTSRALALAEEEGLDLVEIAPDARPPVCRIMDYGKYRYEQSKQTRERRKRQREAQRETEVKEVRFGRSIKIDQHDVEVRIRNARRFLEKGYKVQLTQRFRGREVVHQDIGMQRLYEAAKRLSDIAHIEQPPRWSGRQLSMILAPDPKILEEIRARRQVGAKKKATDTPGE